MSKIKARQIDTGVSSGNVVELVAGGALPAVSGASVTSVDAITLNGVAAGAGANQVVVRDGSGNINANTLGGQPVGTGANDIVALDASSRLPAVDASQLTNIAYRELTINTQAGSYTLILTDAGSYVRMTSGLANNLTVPLNSSVAFSIGTEIIIRQAGTGTITIVATGGVTINTSRTLAIAAKHDSVSLVKVATDVWDLSGATA